MNIVKDFTICIIGSQEWDLVEDNIDVEVKFYDGRRFSATFFTLKNIERLFAKNARTGECAGGLYLWAANMIIVPELSLSTIEATVHDLMATGELESAFLRVE
jgi:hypothetical protein